MQHAQVLLNIMLHFWRSGGSQCYDRSLTNALYNGMDASILRTEIMSPFRDTVCLVHGIKRNLHTLQKVHILLFVQRFWSQIQQFGLAAQHICFHLMNLRAGKRRVDEVSHSIFFREVTHGVHLILHQGYQRRDYDCHTVHQ